MSSPLKNFAIRKTLQLYDGDMVLSDLISVLTDELSIDLYTAHVAKEVLKVERNVKTELNHVIPNTERRV